MIKNTAKADILRDVFKHSLSINARSMSVGTLLSERNLNRINYEPYYQRNYVWDKDKQTFFIESVILGTEVPPLILFKTGNKIEVIDGRQRFETLKRFKENNLSLNSKGLKELQVLKNQSFNKLSDENKDIFLTSNIRIFEFEVINKLDLTEDIIDKVKKEIFRRYNTGITPLTRDELDNAKYDSDIFSEYFKKELNKCDNFFNDFNTCFFPNEEINDNNNGLIAKNVDAIRRFKILHQFPIVTYARGTNRTEIIELLYDFTQNNFEDIDQEFEDFKKTIEQTLYIYKKLSKKTILKNKFIYECILWALNILKQENISCDLNLDKMSSFYIKNIGIYTEKDFHYYGAIIDRFQNTAELFESISGFNFDQFIRNPKFKEKLDGLKQTEEDSTQSIEELSSLRLHKPHPTSTPIDEIRRDLKTSRYLVRPSYQRQEKITELKASSIIESILLGINLPPIFIFKTKNNIKEVVDGQQRLLSIIAYLGEQFSNENGKLTYSKNNNFRLKGLKILTDLEKKRFSELSESYQDKILDFVLDLIIIEEEMNEKFDPIDLFIRLNYKPYPIKQNSFEMWNSIVDIDVIKKIKEIRKEDCNTWFFLREIKDGKPDRMLNEELITSLTYMLYKKSDVIGFFPRQDRITCRLKDKKGLSEFLIDLDNTAIEKKHFLKALEDTKKLIQKLPILFNNELTKDKLNDFLNVKKNKTYSRSLQDFYVIWIVLCQVGVDNEVFENNPTQILNDIHALLCLVKNVDDKQIDEKYRELFEATLNETKMHYKNEQ